MEQGAGTGAAGRGGLALSFVPNAGQADPGVRFLAHGPGGARFSFTPSELMVSLPQPRAELSDPAGPSGTEMVTSRARLRFLGAHAAGLEHGAPRRGTVNYFTGNDPARWRRNLPTYADITYRRLYPGIDLTYDGSGGSLKGTYHVAPRADPSRIRWRYEGAQAVEVDVEGNLQVRLGEGLATMVERAPVAWQDMAEGRRAVPVRYRVGGDGAIGFALGAYDLSRPLTIDPTLLYSTFLGGNSTNWDGGFGVAVDDAGDVYVAGRTTSTNFPTGPAPCGAPATPPCPYQPASPDPAGTNTGGSGFVTKLTPQGNGALDLVWSTYLDGNGALDWPGAIAVDSQHEVYLSGMTSSSDFPTTPGAFQPRNGQSNCQVNINAFCYDAFVTKLNATGSALVYSTYLGGSAVDAAAGGASPVTDIAIDAAGHAYVTSYTDSDDFPVTPGSFNSKRAGERAGFVTKLNPLGTGLVYSALLGGVTDATGIALDASANAYVTGRTRSDDVPTTPGAFQPQRRTGPNCTLEACEDAFVTKLDPSGAALGYSTYLGGAESDQAAEVVIGVDGTAYVLGHTQSDDFPTTPGVVQPSGAGRPSCRIGGGFECQDAFIARFDVGGSELVYSTYLGGGSSEEAQGIAVDGQGDAYVTGFTNSGGGLLLDGLLGGEQFPVVDPLVDADGSAVRTAGLACFGDAFVSKLDAGGRTLAYSDCLGGSSRDGGYGVSVDAARNAYLTGVTFSPDFPVAPDPRPPDASTDLCNETVASAPFQPVYPAGPTGSSGFVVKIGTRGPTRPVTQVACPKLSVGDVRAREPAPDAPPAVAAFVVSLDRPFLRAVTVDYATSPGTAEEGEDYVATSGTLRFEVGELTKTVPVVVSGDDLREQNEDFALNLSNPVNATLASPRGTGTITDPPPANSTTSTTTVLTTTSTTSTSTTLPPVTLPPDDAPLVLAAPVPPSPPPPHTPPQAPGPPQHEPPPSPAPQTPPQLRPAVGEPVPMPAGSPLAPTPPPPPAPVTGHAQALQAQGQVQQQMQIQAALMAERQRQVEVDRANADGGSLDLQGFRASARQPPPVASLAAAVVASVVAMAYRRRGEAVFPLARETARARPHSARFAARRGAKRRRRRGRAADA